MCNDDKLVVLTAIPITGIHHPTLDAGAYSVTVSGTDALVTHMLERASPLL